MAPEPELHTLDLGDPNATPLVFLHGLGSCGDDWQPQIEHFSTRYRVVVPDLRGHGASAGLSAPSSIAQMADDVLRLTRRLQLPTAHFVGISMGGMVALQCALAPNAPMRSLTLVNSTAHARPETLTLRLAFAKRRALIRLLGMTRVGAIVGQALFPAPYQAALRERFIERMKQNDRNAYLAALDAISRWSVLPDLPRIALPVLAVSGDRDYTSVDAKREWVRALRNARLEVVTDSGHATPLDQPQRFNAVLATFLDEVTSHPGEGSNDVRITL